MLPTMKTISFLIILFFAHSTAYADHGSDVIRIAISQIGHSDRDKNCPKNGCYSGFGSNWCSEFVSWVYLQAGIPFTGGAKLPWLLNDTGKIMSWFHANGTFVDPKDPNWINFKPTIGDYVFIGRASQQGDLTDRAHSGLVESVSADGNLHTIEGNNKGRPVSHFEYPLFKTNTRDNGPSNGIVLGFGHRNEH